jgi:hypothetical protein
MRNWKVASIVTAVLAVGAAQADPPHPSDSWQELEHLNIGRFSCKAHSIDGHRAIVLSGQGNEDGPADTSAEILDTDSGEWTLTAPMPVGFAPGEASWTAKLKNGYFLIAGGFNPLVETGDLSSYIYSSSSDSWIRTGDLPVGASLISNYTQADSVVLDDGRVLTASGAAVTAEFTNATTVFTPNYANLSNGMSGAAVGTWDFTRDTQGKVTTLNGASEHHKLIKLLDGRVLLIHGTDHRYVSGKPGTVFRDTWGVQAELFTPATGAWTALPNLPAIQGEDDRHNGVKGVRQQAGVALLSDGRVLVAGGYSQPADARGRPLLKEGFYVRSSSVLFDVAKFDAGANPWSITGSMNVARESHYMYTLQGPGGVIAASGWIGFPAATATVEIYDVTEQKWRVVTGLPTIDGTDVPISRPWGCSAMMPSGQLLIAGGHRDNELGGKSRRAYYYRP